MGAQQVRGQTKMRGEWIWMIGAGLCISMVPACSPLLRQPNELPISPSVQREEPAGPAPASVTPAASNASGLTNDIIKPVAVKPMAEAAHYPAVVTDPDIIPPVAEPSPTATVTPPIEQNAEPRTLPESKAKPAEDPPLLEAFRSFLNKQPDEAVRWLARYDKQSQELLLCLLPLAVRLSEGGWERCDPREASNVVQQLDRVTDRVAAPLRCRAPLSIKKMCFCTEIEDFGKYFPIPDSPAFQPGDFARVYVELQNLWDQPQGKAYSIHLASSVEIRDFHGGVPWSLTLPDHGPDLSYTQRHDFYHTYKFRVPRTLSPGLYTLLLKITDVSTGRTAAQTLDFRVVPANGKNSW
jgi:hypothetical protein